MLPAPVAIKLPPVVVVGAVHDKLAVAVVLLPAAGVVAEKLVGADGR